MMPAPLPGCSPSGSWSIAIVRGRSSTSTVWQSSGDLFGDTVLEPVIEERVGLQQAQGGAVPLDRYEGASGKRLTQDFDALLQTVLESRQHS